MSLLPFAFAKRHGVILTDITPHHAVVYHRPDLNSVTLHEVRHFIGLPLQLQSVSSRSVIHLFEFEHFGV